MDEKRESGSEEARGRARGGRRSGRAEKVDERLFKEAMERAIEQPRLAFYSPVASCILNYWKSAVPRFSISEFLARVVEREIARAWPKLYEKARRALEKRASRRR